MVDCSIFHGIFLVLFQPVFPFFGSAGHDFPSPSGPGLEVGITGFKESKTAQKEGVKDWYRLDVVPWRDQDVPVGKMRRWKDDSPKPATSAEMIHIFLYSLKCGDQMFAWGLDLQDMAATCWKYTCIT